MEVVVVLIIYKENSSKRNLGLPYGKYWQISAGIDVSLGYHILKAGFFFTNFFLKKCVNLDIL